MKRHLSRRTVLRGMGLGGLSIGLPTLDAMIDPRGNWYGEAGAARPPVRFVAYVFPNGLHTFGHWTPPESHGARFSLTPNLKALAPVRDDVNVVTGLRHTTYFIRNFAKFSDHLRAWQTVLTGVPLVGERAAGGPSIDQVIARRRTSGTRFSSLQMAGHASKAYIDGFWASAGQALPPVRNPQTLFAQLFGAPANPGPGTTNSSAVGAAERVRTTRRSVLDYVTWDLARIKKSVSTADHARLDAHLTSIREVESQLGLAAPAGGAEAPAPRTCGADEAPPAPTSGDQNFMAMVRLAVLALQCDVSRVIGFQSNHGYHTFPWLGIAPADRTVKKNEYADEDHNLSHMFDEQIPERLENYAKIIDYKVKVFATLVELLKKSPEAGGGTLLDHTLLLCTSDVGTGNHSCDRMPVLLAGRAGNKITTGRHLVFPAGTPLNRLLLTVGQLCDADIDSFGMDGTAPLTLS